MIAENKKIVGIAVIAAIIVIVVFVFFAPLEKNVVPTSNNQKESIESGGYISSSTNALPTVEGGTRTKVDVIISTPSAHSTSSQGVAIPEEVIPGGDVSVRKFTIRGEGNKFIPSTIVVNELDVITLTFEAIDATYNMYIPDFAVFINAEKGKSAKTQFQATQYGQYQFFCQECGNEMKGALIVNKK
jgi:heme/copper-type cytochrome/quinol oxidase subunit 2